MQSGTLLERNAPASGTRAVRDLLILWQHPGTREIIPIGRFGCHDATFTFAYTRAAAAIADFRPLPGLSDLHRWYESSSIPAVFAQRVMDRHRPDFEAYVGALGLDPAKVTPWEQIVESGGQRAGDTLQFMPLPTVDGGRLRARFLVSGIRHVPDEPRTRRGHARYVTADEQETALRTLTERSVVHIQPEDGNPTDPNALLVVVGDIPVGWVPRVLSASVRELLGAGVLHAGVHRIARPGTPAHVRLVLDLDTPAPLGYDPDREGRWKPFSI